MNALLRSMLLVSLLFSSLPCLAGHEAGNGGQTKVCRNGSQITSIELADFWEHRDLTFNLGAPELSPLAKVEYVLNRLARLDPERAAAYRTMAEVFFSKTSWSAQPLDFIHDGGIIPVPEGCAIEQLAIQLKEDDADGKRYIIDQSLWEHLGPDDQAGLLLHEIVYHEALGIGQRDSMKTRHYNAVICSDMMETMAPDTYQEDLVDIDLQPSVAFSADHFSLSLKAGQVSTLDLHVFLQHEGTGPLVWEIPELPSWASLDADTGLITFRPSSGDLGTSNQVVAVKDGELGDICQLALTITQ